MLHSIEALPVAGHVLLLPIGVALAILIFGCSMALLPIAKFLRVATVPWPATIAFVFGSVLIAPLVQIYRKSFAPKIVWTFVVSYAIGVCAGGWVAGWLINSL